MQQRNLSESKTTLFSKPFNYFKSAEVTITLSESKNSISYNYVDKFSLRKIPSGQSTESESMHITQYNKLLENVRDKIFQTYGDDNYYFSHLILKFVSETNETILIALNDVLIDVAKKEFDIFKKDISSVACPKLKCLIQ